MAVSDDVLQAKQTLSARLLRAGLQGSAHSLGHIVSVRAAVASAGRNVHAVGVGRKIVAGTVTDTTSVRIYVAQKLALSLLPPRDRLPESIDGIPVDVIEAPPAFLVATRKVATRKVAARIGAPGKAKKAKAATTMASAAAAAAASCTDNRRRRQRPVVAGISTAHVDVTAGTLGYFCRSTQQGDDPATVYVLSNNHVFADVNRGQAGDDLLQPGPADGGVASDLCATLHRFVRLQLGGSVPNRVDAAIGALLPGVEFRAEICRIGQITGTALAVEDMEVRKHGRTSGLTEGVVADESINSLVGMDHTDPSIVALFENQMRIDRSAPHPAFGLGGDSGSLVVKRTSREAVGLYFAGPDDGSYGLANHIAEVLAQLQIQLL